MCFGGPIIIEKLFEVDQFASHLSLRPLLLSWISTRVADVGKNVPIYAQASEGTSGEETKDIRELDWCPGCLSSVLFYFHLLQTTSAGTSNLGRLEVNFCISS